jgi:6,7-dimethyl-8-ribityllumazine synthase
MATKDLSQYQNSSVPDAGGMKFGIVVAEWNSEITSSMEDAAVQTLKKYGVNDSSITLLRVPGSFELTAGAQLLAKTVYPDAVICIGCVIRGETPHFDYICQGVTAGLTQLTVKYEIPFIFGVLTTNNLEQALDRAGGKLGNKGTEAAVTAIKMIALNVQSSRKP